MASFGPWSVQGRKGRYSCFSQCMAAARAIARQKGAPVKVVCHGRKPANGNRHGMMASFLMHPNGKKDYTVDPSWYTNRNAGK